MNFVLFLGILLVLGLASTRLMKLFKLPNVTGYLIVGLLAAICCIFVDAGHDGSPLTEQLVSMNDFISTVALGFIALSIGEEFKLSKIKEYGSKIMIITFLQAFAAVLLVDVGLVLACIFLNMNVSIAICLGAIATATAPAATIMVINQYKAHGPLVDILLPVVAFDDAIGLVVFSISVAIAKLFAIEGAAINAISLVVVPLIEIVGSLLLGIILGFLMHIVIKYFKSRNNHAIVIIAFTLLGVGACKALGQIKIDGEALEFSNLLCCMMIGAFYVNIAKEEDRSIINRDIELIDRWTPFLFMLFFVLSGAHLATSAYEIFSNSSNSSLVPILSIFGLYIVLRSLGKYLGAYGGCKITKRDKNITNYLGITLLPQAGVAIGMANQIGAMDAFKVNNIGNIIVTVVLCATLFYELVGPVLTKWSLNKAHEIDPENLK